MVWLSISERSHKCDSTMRESYFRVAIPKPITDWFYVALPLHRRDTKQKGDM